MPNMPDAAVIAAGQVLNVTRITNRDTQADEGFKVSVLNADEGGVVGVCIVTVKRALVDGKPSGPTPIDEPAMMSNVAYVVRNSPYSVGDNSGMSTRFVRKLSPNDLDKLVSFADFEPSGTSSK